MRNLSYTIIPPKCGLNTYTVFEQSNGMEKWSPNLLGDFETLKEAFDAIPHDARGWFHMDAAGTMTFEPRNGEGLPTNIDIQGHMIFDAGFTLDRKASKKGKKNVYRGDGFDFSINKIKINKTDGAHVDERINVVICAERRSISGCRQSYD
jgi:hypothetical protein